MNIMVYRELIYIFRKFLYRQKLEINQQQQRERDLRERKRLYDNREFWLRNHMSLYNLPLEMYEMLDYTFKKDSKEDPFICIAKKGFLPFSRSKKSRLSKKLNPKRWEFICVYKLSKQLNILR